MSQPSVRVALVGLRFGAEFVPIYQSHPDVGEVAVCDQDAGRLRQVGDRFGIERRFASLDEALAAPDIDAVHLLTPLYLHAGQTLQALGAGKHCASAVTMGTTLDALSQIIAAERASGKNYMMMETMLYGREYLYLKERHDRGDMGALSFLRGLYFQDVEGYPDYWRSVPPMHYATHVVAPLLALAGTRALSVSCLGSGRLSERLLASPSSPFPLETGIFRLRDTPVAMEITRSWFQTARQYIEGIQVYGDRLGFEWNPAWDEPPLLFELRPAGEDGRRPVDVARVELPDYADRLPAPIREFTGGAHGGSHPHLVHEFVRSIVERRPSAIDAVTAANWTAPGICAHESALRDGAQVTIPAFQ